MSNYEKRLRYMIACYRRAGATYNRRASQLSGAPNTQDEYREMARIEAEDAHRLNYQADRMFGRYEGEGA